MRAARKMRVLWQSTIQPQRHVHQQSLASHTRYNIEPCRTRDLSANVRCMSSGRGEERSWSEIAGDAVGVARSALSKLGKSVSQAVGSLVPTEQQETRPPPRPPQRGYGRSNGNYGQLNPWERESSSVGPSLIGGLFGRAMGGMLSGAMQQLQNQQEEAAELRERALRAIQADRRLQERLGGRLSLSSAGGFSTSSSTQILNGRSIVTLNMQFPITGSSGRQALAVVRQAKGSSSLPVVSIEVRMPEGDIVRVGEGGSRGGDRFPEGDVIDVEVRDVR